METQEKRRPGSGRKTRPGGGNPRTGTGQTMTGKRRQQTRPARKRPAGKTVRPPSEPIPEVHYTMPKPFSRGGFLLKLASVAAVVAALLMCFTLFFRVEEVVVSGTDKYTPWMVKEASGIQDGDSLLSISDARIAGKIRLALPYVKEVRVGIKLPGTVQIEITELEMTYAIEATDHTWWLIAADGRVIEPIEPTASSGYTRILGIQADGPRADHMVEVAEEAPEEETGSTDETGETTITLPVIEQTTNAQRLEVALTILEHLERNGIIGQIASIDVENLNDITMEYGQRLHVVLGTSENLPYKIAYMAQAIAQIASYETGELDVSFKFSEQALLNPQG